MKIVKIVVDELQSACYNCKFFHVNGGFSDECIATSKLLDNYDILHGIPDWCPLQVEEVCEWVHKFYDTYKSSCQESIVSQSSFIYCPTCGKRIKRIKYVKSEE